MMANFIVALESLMQLPQRIGLRMVEDFHAQPDMVVSVQLPARLWEQPKTVERCLWAPVFEWLVDGKLCRYKVPIIQNNGVYDERAMMADLIRACRSTVLHGPQKIARGQENHEVAP